MANDVKKKIRRERSRSYLAKDFNALRSDLLQYARTYFPDKIKDFSEASVGGLFLDMAAYIGDTMSFYLDHQFSEMNWITANETSNLIKHIRAAGVKATGASPAISEVDFYIEVPSEEVSAGKFEPKFSTLPVILEGTVLESVNGVLFTLIKDIDFAEKNAAGVLKASVMVEDVNDGKPSTYILRRREVCVSGLEETESFSIPDIHKPFREITLGNEHVSEVVSVTDSEGNEYYEVESLTQDTIFMGILNYDVDKNLVPLNLEIKPAPRRFVSTFDPSLKLTTIRFGGGDSSTFDDDIIPDPSELSLPLYNKKSFSRFSIDPNNLLKSHTLGLAPKNTTITVRYRYGGGLSHNVPSKNIRSIKDLIIEFRRQPPIEDSAFVRRSLDVTNPEEAAGGDRAPTIEELRAQIPVARTSQSRVVSKEDLMTRIYTMPVQFGRVFRLSIRQNPNNPLASQLFVLCRNESSQLTVAPDALKINLKKYLNEFRLISDAIDVLDGTIINFGVKFEVVAHPSSNKAQLVQKVMSSIKDVCKMENFQMDQPILIDDIRNVIINTEGVLSLVRIEIINLVNTVEDRVYSQSAWNMRTHNIKGLIIGPPGSVFEMRFPENDIKGSVS